MALQPTRLTDALFKGLEPEPQLVRTLGHIMPSSKDPHFTPRPQRTVQAGDPPNSQYTPSKASTRAGNAPQTRVRARLGLINNDDMFLQEIKLFLKDYAPCSVGIDQVEKCIERLRSLPEPIIHVETTESGRKLSWEVFPVYPDQYKGKAGHENEVFKPLKTLFEAILGEKDPSNKIHFELCPRTNIDGDIPGGNHLIDGCFMSEKYDLKSTHLCHRDIDIAVELKKHRNQEDRDESHRQIIGACHHILSEDPRRMWIYGLTIEKNWMTVWYFSRSHSVKTFAFDWFENVEIVIQLILSFALATPAQLGIDPLVHKGPKSSDGKTWSYVYEVPESVTGGSPRFYKTGQSRIPERPMCIAGRVTRIWEVVEVKGRDGRKEICGGAKCILKDVWLDKNADTEAENMDKIFKSVDDIVTAGLEAEVEQELKQNSDFVRDPATMNALIARFIDKEKRFKCFNDDTKERLRGYLTDEKYRSLFLTKRHAWRGQASKKLGKDVRHCPTLFPRDPITSKTSSQSVASEGHHRDSYQSPEIEILTRQAKGSAVRQEVLTNRRFVPKQQSRFVYDEVCTRIDRLPTLGDVVDVLSEAVDALHILFLAGWVHRDISVGNILAISAPSATSGRQWKVKLSDLEFSRIMVDPDRVPRSDPRTGTPFFMPSEILRRRYRFQDFRIDAVRVNSAQSKFEKRTAGKPKTVPAARESAEPKEDTSLAGQVKKATQLDYPHLKAFAVMPFDITDMLEATELDPAEIPPKSAVVNHNFQHDLESVWWILLWFITQGINNERPSDWVDVLFQHDVDNFHPRIFAFENRVDSHLQDQLPNVLIEGLFPDFMEALRMSMSNYYILRPIYGQLNDPESYSDIHALFAEFLYDYKLDREAHWRKLVLKHSGTLGLIKLPGSGVAPKRVRTRSVSRAPGSSKKRRSQY